MSDLESKLRALTPAQRELLQRTLARKRGAAEPAADAQAPLTDAEDQWFALSSEQLARWAQYRLRPHEQGSHNNVFAARVHGAIDPQRLSAALTALLRRHPMLRARIGEHEGEPAQRIQAQVGDALRIVDASGLSETQLRERVTEDALRAFDLDRPPLLRACVYQAGADAAVLMIAFDHIAGDGWSYWRLLQELGELLDAAAPDAAQAPPAGGYSQRVRQQREWLQGADAQRQHEYWSAQLAGDLQALPLPADAPRPARGDGRRHLARRQLPQPLAQRLTELARAHDSTLFSVLLAGYKIVLHRYTAQDDIVVGSPVPGRGDPRWSEVTGDFVNVLALRDSVHGDDRVAALLARVRDTVYAGMNHQDYPFGALLERLPLRRGGDDNPVFQTLFVLQKARHGAALAGLWREPDEAEPVAWGGLSLRPYPLPLSSGGHGGVGLMFEALEWDDGIGLVLSCDADRYRADTAERIADACVAVLEGMAADPDARVDALPILGAHERQRLLETFNDTAAPFPDAHCLHQQFQARVVAAPEATAVVGEGERWSYAELDSRANRLAHRLIQAGVGPEQRVAVCMQRSPAMVVALLATLKAGGAYVPLDPGYPPQRLEELLADCAPQALLADATGRAALGAAAQAALDPNEVGDGSEHAPQVEALGARNLAYVIYTSGSTGRPKGVMVEHRSVVNRLAWMQSAYGLQPGEPVLLKTPFSFDVSVWEFFWPLLYGATVVVAAPEAHKDPAALAATIVEHGVTTVHFVPSMLGAFLRSPHAAGCTSLRRAVCSGEALPAPLARRWRELLPWAALHNLYGPTEATVDVTAWTCPDDFDADTVPIGKPIDNIRAYVLDGRGEPAPLGAIGELYLGGVGVARGYLNRPELSAERFVHDPFHGDADARMYRTGDLARWSPDGELLYLGRNDHQVKIRGFRIELGEIEARLCACAPVREAVVLAQGEGEAARLVAYVLAEPDPGLAAELRERLLSSLPEHMVPSAFVRMDAWPLTPNGKLDRRALPAPDAAALAQRAEYAPPQGEAEIAIAAVWRELLELERIGRDDNFFALGGHSLKAIGMAERLRRQGWAVEAGAVFAAPTVRALAAQASAASATAQAAETAPPNLIEAGSAAIDPSMLPLAELTQAEIDRIVAATPGGAANIEDIYALSPLQQGLLFHHLLGHDAGDTYVQRWLLEFASRADLQRFLDAAQVAVDRHAALRTALHWQELAQPVQVVLRRASVPVEELGVQGDALETLRRHSDPRRQRLDLRQAPLLRACVAQASDGTCYLALLGHHAIVDGATLQLLLDELSEISAGRAAALPPPWPYRNFIAAARRQPAQAHEAYFRARLHDVDEPTAPYGALDVHGGADLLEAQAALPASLSAQLREGCRRAGATPAALFHLAWALVVARASGRETVVFGTVLSGRQRAGEGAQRALGLFANTLPLRVDLAGTAALQGLERIQAHLAELLDREQAPLALAQRCSAVDASLPLFTSVFNYQRRRDIDGDGAMRLWDGARVLGGEQRSNYPLSLNLDDDGRGFRVGVQCCAPMDPQRIVAAMLTAVEGLVQALAQRPQRLLAQIDTLPAGERALLLHDFGVGHAADADEPAPEPVHARIEAWARATPHAPALLHADGELSYAELNARANRLAHRLIALGAGPEQRIALCLERSPQMVVAVLAVLKSGAAYVPLDPDYPAQRLADSLADTAPLAILADVAGRAALAGAQVRAPLLDPAADDADEGTAQDSADPCVPGLGPDSLAYVIYTSGSTGRPKGVMIEHGQLAASTRVRNACYGDTAQLRFLLLSPLAFDSSVAGLFGTLCAGGALCLPARDAALSPPALARAIAEHRITRLLCVPSLARLLLPELRDDAHASLAELIVAGEACPPALAAETAALRGDGAAPIALYNEYGPTEATVWASVHRCDEETGATVPIGRPIGGARIYLLDPHGEPVPVGVPGELFVGGRGVARGYLNRPELSAERFVRDPFVAAAGARMYRTGDLARWRADGALEYLGRNDAQVKIRGFRIEPGEIEAALLRCDGVAEAAVIAREDAPGDKRLVAYAVARPGVALDAAGLREQLALGLAEHMLPSAYVQLPALPLSPNGKLDRRALPAPDAGALAVRGYEPPLGETEQAIAEVWQQSLGVERVGRHDNFFALGGHSLKAIGMVERLRQRGLNLDAGAVFAAPTPQALASRLAANANAAAAAVDAPPNLIAADATAIEPSMLPLAELSQDEIDRIVAATPGGVANIEDIYGLSPLQEGMLFHHLLADAGGDAYVQRWVLAFDSRARLDEFLAAARQVSARHGALRTALHWQGLPQPVQVVQRRADIPLEELPAQADALDALLRHSDPRRQRLDLGQAPLLRACMIESDDGACHLALLGHHLIIDHVSLELLLEEMQAIVAGRAETLPAPWPYRDFIAAVRRAPAVDFDDYFRARLGDIDEPTAPFGALEVRGNGQDIHEAEVALPAELSAQVRDLAQRHGATPAALLHLAWALVAARASGRESVVFGTVLSGRQRGGEGAARALGLFVNTLPLRVDLGATPVVEALAAMQANLADLVAHEYASLAQAQRCSGVDAARPLFTSVFNYRHNRTTRAGAHTPLWDGARVIDSQERSNYPLLLNLNDDGEGFSLGVQCCEPMDPQRIGANMRMAVAGLVEALAQEPQRALARIEVLPAEERALLLQQRNATEAAYPHESCLHELFRAQADATPDAIAVIGEGRRWSYAELDARANRLAHRLAQAGVGPDRHVAVCMQRSPAMVVALLATLKAGGAYVPLDPSYPAQRLAELIEDAAPMLLLADAVGRAALDGHTLETIDPNEDVDGPGHDPHVDGMHSRRLAYVMYTSGSTGRPKGVMIEHRSVVNRLAWMQTAFGLQPEERVLQKTPFTFDLSVWEFFWTLLWGGTLVVAAPDAHKDPAALAATIVEHEVTTAHFVPSMLGVFLQAPEASHCVSLRRTICGGEALPAAMVRKWYARLPWARLHNLYGPTEATLDVTAWACPPDFDGDAVPIGRPIDNNQVYVLDGRGQPVPTGAIGELHLGGVGIARGYLNRAELTAERFVHDPFHGDADARMYRTGDLTRWSPDGELLYLGRNDHQIKIRGFRVELGEIEAHLCECDEVREAVVVAHGSGESTQLLAYVLAAPDPQLAASLRAQLLARLPEHMVPAAFVRLDEWPVMPNGKLDRRALPAPDAGALAVRGYEPPQGETEQAIAEVWQQSLGVERVGRHDNFFALGGHSLKAIGMVERLRQRGLNLDAGAVFAAPTPQALASRLAANANAAAAAVDAPPNLIAADATAIEPSMLPLAELSQDEIDRIVAATPGGVANIEDIYGLSPLQEGMLFHHLLVGEEGGAYVQRWMLGFDSRASLQRFLAAMTVAVARHGVLRTALHWQGLSQPVQVVQRQAALRIDELLVQDEALAELRRHTDPRRQRLELDRAPLLRAYIAEAGDGACYLALLGHHAMVDHLTLELLLEELREIATGGAENLPAPKPYRDFIAAVRRAPAADFDDYFRARLGDIDEPTAPFGAIQVHGSGRDLREATLALPAQLSARVRAAAQQRGATPAALLHLAWALVVARSSGRESVVFGTVLSGRQRGDGAARALGIFVNTLPLRVDLAEADASAALAAIQADLAELMQREHASLAQAQRCSGVDPAAPLFTSVFNYRHSREALDGAAAELWDGVRVLGGEGRSNYPLALNLNDDGEGFSLGVQCGAPMDPQRIGANLRAAVEGLLDALANPERGSLAAIDVLPAEEHALLLQRFALADEADGDAQTSLEHAPAAADEVETIHARFRAQAQATPAAIAISCGERRLSYAEVEADSNRLAQHLIALGLDAESRIAVCLPRGPEFVVGLLAVLKAGCAYVPLDPAYPLERQRYLLADSGARAVLTDHAQWQRLLPACDAASPPVAVLFDDATTVAAIAAQSPRAEDVAAPATAARSLAHVIYTSGSTGQPKGAMLEHAGVVELMTGNGRIGFQPDDCFAHCSSQAFDMTTWEVWGALLNGARLHVVPREALLDADRLNAELLACGATQMMLPTGLFNEHAEALQPAFARLRDLLVGGDVLDPARIAATLRGPAPPQRLWNVYGPTETTVIATAHRILASDCGGAVPLGRPIAGARLYLLDARGRPVPVGAVGELHIGGGGVGRGYLGRDALTAERFLPDPFVDVPDARMYKTGDQARWRADGTLEFLGRNDFQVKIRGYRVEPGEIEAALAQCQGVREAVVIARGESAADKHLVAYVVARPGSTLEPAQLREQLAQTLADYMLPAAYVLLDGLPLTPNGKLDRRALPAPDAAALAVRGYAPPQGPIERAIAAEWQELLGVERIGRYDDFFALGGHSLNAMRSLARLQQALGREVPLAALLARPSVAELAAALERDLHGLLAVPLRRAAAGVPTFCLHLIDGSVTPYLALAQTLGEAGPVYGLQAPDPDELAARSDDLESLAEAYADEIERIHGEGGCRLVGWSAGGVFATAVAQSLERRGRRVDSLTLLDCRPIEPQSAQDEWTYAMALAIGSMRGRFLDADEHAALDAQLRAAELQPEPFLALQAQAQALSFLQAWTGTTILPQQLAHLRSRMRTMLACFGLLRGYRPPSLRVRPHRLWVGEPGAQAWPLHPHSERDGEIHGRTEGDHESMMQPPHAAGLGRAIVEEWRRQAAAQA